MQFIQSYVQPSNIKHCTQRQEITENTAQAWSIDISRNVVSLLFSHKGIVVALIIADTALTIMIYKFVLTDAIVNLL